MPASRPTAQPAGPLVVSGVSMRDLLASCAAADAVSRPPRQPEPEKTERAERERQHRRAA
ncbi:hypothetical protein ACFWIO_14615 [Streptomyces diastatochromogenes]|uniref:hypothetical protein n=1 Tax=Streptomyces diastatochromogenes TaxID=42236 RepID=UPI00365F15F9